MPDTKVQQENTTNIQEKPLELMTQAELFVYAQALLKENEKLAAKRVKYGLVWEDHDEDIVKQCQENVPVLQEVKARFVQGAIKIPPAPVSVQLDAFDTSNANVVEVQNLDDVENNVKNPAENINHILIEADNYHALSVLNYTHKGKIDVIYIDPPYNTGNNDFIYNDRFVDRNDSFRHSKWISFMEKRLKLAKELLKDTGAIFISIDDNEMANLKLLCDKVFGNDNFITNFLWKKKSTSTNVKGAQVSSLTDYNLVYKKSANTFLTQRIRSKETRNYPLNDAEGNYRLTIIEKKNAGSYQRDTMTFEILGQKPRNGKRWQIGQETARDYENKHRFIINEGVIKLKIYDFEDRDTTSAHPNILDVHGTTDAASKLVNEDILNIPERFSNPKPVELINFFIQIYPDKNSIILDFFAGSGTTAHAVMQLNAEDGGNRQCILVTNNENKICEEVTFERCRRVIEGYTTPKGETIEGLAGNNLRYFKTDFVPYTLNSDQLRFSITGKCTEMLCLRENVFDLFVESKTYKIFKEGDKYVAIFYDMYSSEFEQLRDVMNNIEGEKVLYFFSLDHEPNTSELKDWNNIKIEPIPQKILDLYRQLFKENRR